MRFASADRALVSNPRDCVSLNRYRSFARSRPPGVSACLSSLTPKNQSTSSSSWLADDVTHKYTPHGGIEPVASTTSSSSSSARRAVFEVRWSRRQLPDRYGAKIVIAGSGWISSSCQISWRSNRRRRGGGEGSSTARKREGEIAAGLEDAVGFYRQTRFILRSTWRIPREDQIAVNLSGTLP